jgi:hypothetical protein
MVKHVSGARMNHKHNTSEGHSQPNIQKVREVKQAYEAELLSKANVIGVGIGLARKGSALTQETALIVLVRRKVPVSQLNPKDIIPRMIDGVLVDVQEAGEIKAQK